jgi:hypothetical protein
VTHRPSRAPPRAANHHAGVTGRSFPAWELTREARDQVFAVEIRSVFLVRRAAVRFMPRGKAARYRRRSALPYWRGLSDAAVNEAALIASYERGTGARFCGE